MITAVQIILPFLFICIFYSTFALSKEDEITANSAWDSNYRNDITKSLPEKIHSRLEGTGPLSPAILEANPRLDFIGTINSKNFYIDRTLYSWDAAGYFCDNLGMQMARFDTTAEKDFVYARLPSSDGEIWTGAKFDFSYYYYNYYWQDNGLVVPPRSFRFYYNAEAAKTLIVDINNAYPNTYNGQMKINSHFAVCYL